MSMKTSIAPALEEGGSIATIRRLEDNIATVVQGKRDVIRLAVVCLLAKGHLLIEDVPGVGKTTLAQALARSLGVEFQRIQFTSDLLPSDIIGVSVYNQKDQQFQFRPGPIFANIVLSDEINRATPKTQSALLEAMSEGKVSVERQRYILPQPFLVLATQNPMEYQGTFPLPESQLDRFLMSLQVGYPARGAERKLLLSGGVEELLANLPAVCDSQQLVELQAQVPGVKVAEKLADYMLSIAEASRTSGELLLGVSTRGAQGLFRSVQALAFYEGRDYAIPDDVQQLVAAVLAHRVVVKRSSAGTDSAHRILQRLVASVRVPI